jgi:hypothetical protein
LADVSTANLEARRITKSDNRLPDMSPCQLAHKQRNKPPGSCSNAVRFALLFIRLHGLASTIRAFQEAPTMRVAHVALLLLLASSARANIFDTIGDAISDAAGAVVGAGAPRQ